MLSMAARLLVRDPRRFSKSYDLAIADARAALESAEPFFCWNQPRGKLEARLSSRIIPIRTIHLLVPAPSVAAQSTKGNGAVVAGIGDKGAVSPFGG